MDMPTYTAVVIPQTERETLYKALFGDTYYKGMPLSFYAERLFEEGLKQMIPDVDWAKTDYEFIKIDTADFEIQAEGFAPHPTFDHAKKEAYVITPHSGARLDLGSGFLVVWMYLLNQIFNCIDDVEAKVRISNTLDDFNAVRNGLFILPSLMLSPVHDGMMAFGKETLSDLRGLVN